MKAMALLVMFAVGLWACGGASYSEEIVYVGADGGVHAAQTAPDAATEAGDPPPATVDGGAPDSDPPGADASSVAVDADPPDAGANDAGGDAVDAADSCVPLLPSVACAGVLPDSGVSCYNPADPVCGQICGAVPDGCGGAIQCGNPCPPLTCLGCANGGTNYGITPGACGNTC